MLRALRQLGKGGEAIASFGVPRVVDLQQNGAISLHDQRVGGIVMHYAFISGAGRRPQCAKWQCMGFGHTVQGGKLELWGTFFTCPRPTARKKRGPQTPIHGFPCPSAPNRPTL